jgi:hypothetical protein
MTAVEVKSKDGTVLLDEGDVLFARIGGEQKIIRIDSVRGTAGRHWFDYSVLYPVISVGCLAREKDFADFSNMQHLFTLVEQDLESFLQFLRFAEKLEKIKGACLTY